MRLGRQLKIRLKFMLWGKEYYFPSFYSNIPFTRETQSQTERIKMTDKFCHFHMHELSGITRICVWWGTNHGREIHSPSVNVPSFECNHVTSKYILQSNSPWRNCFLIYSLKNENNLDQWKWERRLVLVKIPKWVKKIGKAKCVPENS